MTDAEKLARARNLIRYIFRKMDNEFEIRYRENSKFFFDMMERAVDVGVVEEDRGRYILTDREKVTGNRKRARHLGRHPREKHALL